MVPVSPATPAFPPLQPLPAELALGSGVSIREPLLAEGRLFWAEQRPQERGRTTLMLRQQPGAEARDLTPGPWNLRSRAHEFGGGCYAVAAYQVVFIHDGDGCLWQLCLASSEPPRRLTEPQGRGERCFAEGLIDLPRQRWLGVLEAGGRDQLVTVPLAGGEPQLLRGEADFCSSAVLSSAGDQLAWLEWSLPWMPWERTQLWWSPLSEAGELLAPRCLAGGEGEPQSLFQPLWGPHGQLLVASDRSGWWNLQSCQPRDPGEWQLIGPQPAECAMPQWVFRMATLAVTDGLLLALFCRQGEWQLCQRPLAAPAAEPWQPQPLPFNDLASLTAEGERLVCLASGPSQGQGLLELELATGQWRHQPAMPALLPLEALSLPESLWFEGGDGQQSQAWYYPPQGGRGEPAPLLVRSHSGPTAMARTALNLAIQYWTGRGWGVVDVNYGGSTGFGRAYRQRLDGQWGLLDVADCAAAARQLIELGRADPRCIAIEGGSAGGFTTLAALIADPVFKAGACRYAVSDLAGLVADTHRFESGYLDRLIGPWPGAKEIYEQRSPLTHRQQLRCPLIFFQGLQDRVVPPAQTEAMVAALRQQGVAVEVLFFEEEGHGFRSPLVQRQMLEATERFFRRVLPVL